MRQLTCLVCLAVFTANAWAAEPRLITARLNGLDLAINEATGSLVELAFPATGTILTANPQNASLLDVAYPIEAFPPLRLASRFSKATVTKEARGSRLPGIL